MTSPVNLHLGSQCSTKLQRAPTPPSPLQLHTSPPTPRGRQGLENSQFSEGEPDGGMAGGQSNLVEQIHDGLEEPGQEEEGRTGFWGGSNFYQCHEHDGVVPLFWGALQATCLP